MQTSSLRVYPHRVFTKPIFGKQIFAVYNRTSILMHISCFAGDPQGQPPRLCDHFINSVSYIVNTHECIARQEFTSEQMQLSCPYIICSSSYTFMCIEYETELLLLYLLVKWSHKQRGLSLGAVPGDLPQHMHDTCMRIEVRLYTAKVCLLNIGFVNTLCG